MDVKWDSLQIWLRALRSRHTHICRITYVFFLLTLLLSLIYFVSRVGLSSSTYQLPPFNSKLQVLDNPKSLDQRFGFIMKIDILLLCTDEVLAVDLPWCESGISQSTDACLTQNIGLNMTHLILKYFFLYWRIYKKEKNSRKYQPTKILTKNKTFNLPLLFFKLKW